MRAAASRMRVSLVHEGHERHCAAAARYGIQGASMTEWPSLALRRWIQRRPGGRRVTRVAPHPPALSSASRNESTSGRRPTIA